jgi:hypothetical protein
MVPTGKPYMVVLWPHATALVMLRLHSVKHTWLSAWLLLKHS